MAHGTRQRKEWTSIPGIQLPMTSGATLLGGSVAFASAATVLRMLGEYIITPTSAATAGDAAVVGVAIGVVSSDAFAAGAGSMPDPTDEPEYPWLYWANHSFFFPSTLTLLGQTDAGSIRRSFDIRSMRKLKPRESLAFVAQYTDRAGAPPLQLDVAVTRVLVGTS